MTIAYSNGTPADAAALDAMAQESWVATFGHLYSDADLQTYLRQAYGPAGQLTADLADPEKLFRIARAPDGSVAGYAKLGPVWLPRAEPGAMQLSQLYVLEPWKGHGIAQALMAWTADTARARGATALLLTVWENNHRAIRFYERQGFVHIGDYGFAIGEQIDRDLIMRLAL